MRLRQSLPNAAATWSLFAVALLWTLPFLQPRHFFPLPMFYSEWLAFVCGLAALVLLAGKQAWAQKSLPVVAGIPLALAAVILAQAAAGLVPYTGQAYAAMLYLVWAAALVVLGVELRRRLGLAFIAPVLAWVLVASGVVCAAAGAVQYFDLHEAYAPLVMPPIGGVHANLAQKNHYADYLALAVASLGYLYAGNRVRGVAAGAIGAVLIFGLGVSGSRSAWLYLLVIFALALWYRRRTGAPEAVRLLRFGLVALAALGVDQWLMTLSALAHGNPSTLTQRVFAEDGATRLEHLRVVGWMATQSPVWGGGWGQFAWSDFQFKSASDVSVLLGVTNNAHNIMTHILAETGLAGLLIVAGGAILWGGSAVRDCRTLHALWALVLLSILGVHSMLEYPLWHAHFLGIAAIAVGFTAGHSAKVSGGKFVPAAFAGLLAAGTAAAALLARDYREYEALSVHVAVRPEEARAGLADLARRSAVLRPYVELTLANHMPVDAAFLTEKLALNERVMHFFPAPMVVFRQAVLLALSSQPDQATALFERGMKVYPGAVAQVSDVLRRLSATYPAQIAPLLELASSKHPPSLLRTPVR